MSSAFFLSLSAELVDTLASVFHARGPQAVPRAAYHGFVVGWIKVVGARGVQRLSPPDHQIAHLPMDTLWTTLAVLDRGWVTPLQLEPDATPSGSTATGPLWAQATAWHEALRTPGVLQAMLLGLLTHHRAPLGEALDPGLLQGLRWVFAPRAELGASDATGAAARWDRLLVSLEAPATAMGCVDLSPLHLAAGVNGRPLSDPELEAVLRPLLLFYDLPGVTLQGLSRADVGVLLRSGSRDVRLLGLRLAETSRSSRRVSPAWGASPEGTEDGLGTRHAG